MPHFYRYRVEDNFEPLSRGRTPAALSPAPVRRQVSEASCTTPSATAVAHISLLGCGAEISVPETGSESNKMNLSLLFKQLENTVKELKDENKLLR